MLQLAASIIVAKRETEEIRLACYAFATVRPYSIGASMDSIVKQI